MEKLIVLSALALTFAVGFIMGSERTERKYNDKKKP
jgi:tryptophan-rich sensory protein